MSGAIVSVQQEVADARLNGFHMRLGIMVTLLTMFDGFDTFNPAYVIHYVMGPWGLKPAQAGLLVSSGLVGFLIGSAGHGMIADRIGRRATLLGAIWIASLFTLATALFAGSFASFCLIRLFTGLGLGVLLPLGTTYINELAPKKVANVFTVWGVAFGWATGGTVAGLVGVFATPVWGWRSIYYLGSLSFLLLIQLHLYLPESVRFLALRGRHDEIRRLLAKLRPERTQIYAKARIADPVAVSAQGSLAVLLGARYRRTTLAIWASAFLVLFCIFGLSGWIPTVMMQRGETFSTSFAFGALMQIGSFIGGLACGWISDRRGSARAALACWWLIGAVSVFTLALVNNHMVNLIGTAAAGIFVVGGQFVLNNATAATYDTGVRATGVGMELGVGRIGAILGPFVVGMLQQIHPGPLGMFVAIGLASTLAALVIGSVDLGARAPVIEIDAEARDLLAGRCMGVGS